MTSPFTLYGDAGTGSVLVEAALTLLDLAYDRVDVPDLDQPAAGAAFGKVNPMRQVPALVLPSGQLMTESAAILIWLADSHPASGLSPALDGAERPAFLRWMAFVSASIYSLYWIRDDPSRLAADARSQAVVKARTMDRILVCWRMMEAQVSPGRYILGEALTVLDLYVTVISRWGPRRRRFGDVAPHLAEVVRRVDADPRLGTLWAERFPFGAGWEG
ncbi:MAG: glutathione S-transferase family protein [Caulobacteraceae bacterium]